MIGKEDKSSFLLRYMGSIDKYYLRMRGTMNLKHFYLKEVIYTTYLFSPVYIFKANIL